MSNLQKIGKETVQKAFMSLPLKEAVGVLEELPVEEIRDYLEENQILGDMPMLRQVVETSLTLTGGEEHSAIIAALEPAEIAKVVNISPGVFSQERFDLIHPLDYTDSKKWLALSNEEAEVIKRSNDQRLIRRMHKFSEDTEFASGRKGGQWAIFKDELAILPVSIAGYVSAICNADRDNEWKEVSLYALGVELLAYAAKLRIEIFRDIDEISPTLAEVVANISFSEEDEGLLRKACESHQELADKLEAESNVATGPDLIAEAAKSGNKDLARLVADLRDVGIQNPTQEDIQMMEEMNNDMDTLLIKGAG